MCMCLSRWMDWMSHDGVNAPVAETLKYMGTLYAANPELGDWMLDVERLVTALTRAWIFQEMSFGALDKEAMGHLLDSLRACGQALRDAPTDGAAVRAYIRGCRSVASLLSRRAFHDVAAKSCRWFAECPAVLVLGTFRVESSVWTAAQREIRVLLGLEVGLG